MGLSKRPEQDKRPQPRITQPWAACLPPAPSPTLPGQPGELQGQPSPKRQAVLLPWDMM